MGFNSIMPPGYSGKFTTSHFNTYSSTMETCFMANLKTGMHTSIKESTRKIPAEGMVKNAIENLSMSMFLVGGFVGSKSQAGGSSHRGREIFNIWDIICDKMKGYNGYRENEYPSSFFKEPTNDQRGVSSDLKIKETNKNSKTKFADVTAVSSECFLAGNYHKFMDKQFQINEPKGSLKKSQSSSSEGWECPLTYEKEHTPNSTISNCPKTDTINAPSVSAVEPPSENQPSSTNIPDIDNEMMPDQPDPLCVSRPLENRNMNMSEEVEVTNCDLVNEDGFVDLLAENETVLYIGNQLLDSDSSDSEWSFCSDLLCVSDTKKVRTLSDCSIDSDDSFIIFDGTNCCDDALLEISEDDFSDDESSEDDTDEDDSEDFSDDVFSEDSSSEDDDEKLDTAFTSIEYSTPCDNYLHAVNMRWNRFYAPTKEKPKKMSSKKVTFASDEDLVVWAYTDSESSSWQQEILDRLRFQDRIGKVAQTLNPILETDHRQRIYDQRFNSD